MIREVLEDLESENRVVRLRELEARDVGDDVGPLVGVDVERGDGHPFRAEVVRREARADANLQQPVAPPHEVLHELLLTPVEAPVRLALQLVNPVARVAVLGAFGRLALHADLR